MAADARPAHGGAPVHRGHAGARERLARREPHNAHDFTYLRTTALAEHAREHGYHEELAQRAFEVFLAARCEVTLFETCCPDWRAFSGPLPLGHAQ